MSKQERILTEDEINFLETNALGTKYWSMADALQSVINSHRALLAANAALSFKNMELQKELAAEKETSEFWRRRLHKEAKPND